MNSPVTGSLLIGLTGGIASGKSTVLQHLRQAGYSVIDADKLGHKVLEQGNPGYNKVVKCFGNEILNPDGSVNRTALGRIVFVDAEKLKQLNEISHPIIAEMIQKEFDHLAKLELKAKDVPYEERDHALYIAFGPYENPRYALSIIVEHGGSGSSTAAPMAKKLFKLIIDRHEEREKIIKQNLIIS